MASCIRFRTELEQSPKPVLFSVGLFLCELVQIDFPMNLHIHIGPAISLDENLEIYMIGELAREYTGKRLEVEVLQSQRGFYIGTMDHDGPVSRESLEYWRTREAANQALSSGAWTQKDTP